MDATLLADGHEIINESSDGILYKSALQQAMADSTVAWDLLDENVLHQPVPAPPVPSPTSVASGASGASGAALASSVESAVRRGRGRSSSSTRPGPYSDPFPKQPASQPQPP